MKRRTLAMILVVTMLTSCGSSSEGITTTTAEASMTAEASATDNAAAATSETSEQTYVTPEMKGEISISVVEQSDIIDTAAQLFMEKYPDVTVTVNSFRTVEEVELADGTTTGSSSDDEGETDEDYLNLLNTQLMSGKADDIVLTDTLPMSKYIEMGAFVDLSDYLSRSTEISSETHDMNAFEMVKEADDGLYEIPLTWGPGTMLCFEQALMDASGMSLDDDVKSMSYTDALEYAKQMVDCTDLPNTYLENGNSALNTACQLVSERMDEFVDLTSKNVNFDNQDFIDILDYAKGLEDAGYYDTEDTLDFYNMEYHFGLEQDYNIQAAYFALSEENEVYIPQANANGTVSGWASYCLAITSGSENKELAWEFIKFMLSDEVQTQPSLYGFGVNYNGREAYIESGFQMYDEDSEHTVTLEDYTALLNSWFEQIDCYTQQDYVISSQFLYPEVKKFFNGEQSAEATAAALQSKVDKYLNE